MFSTLRSLLFLQWTSSVFDISIFTAPIFTEAHTQPLRINIKSTVRLCFIEIIPLDYFICDIKKSKDIQLLIKICNNLDFDGFSIK